MVLYTTLFFRLTKTQFPLCAHLPISCTCTRFLNILTFSPTYFYSLSSSLNPLSNILLCPPFHALSLTLHILKHLYLTVPSNNPLSCLTHARDSVTVIPGRNPLFLSVIRVALVLGADTQCTHQVTSLGSLLFPLLWCEARVQNCFAFSLMISNAGFSRACIQMIMHEFVNLPLELLKNLTSAGKFLI